MTIRGSDRRPRRAPRVLVTHRQANVRHADRILVLEQGRRIEHGRHEQLMILRGTTTSCSLQARADGASAGEPDTVPA
jgi:ATP-binding cassette subfamily B protein